jgi:hypothetical protein
MLGVSLALVGNLRALGASQNGPTKTLQQASIDGDVEQLKLHVARGANLNKLDDGGCTPLERTIESHRVEAAKFLIESGKVDLNIKDARGMTALIFAGVNAEPEVALMLIAKGADIKSKDQNDTTALHAALRTNLMDVAAQLIEKGADVNSADKTGQTPLTLAQQRNAPDIVQLLKSKGAKEPVLDEMYGYGQSAGVAAPAPGTAPAPTRPTIQIDPNEIAKLMKEFEGLAASLKPLEDKSRTEQLAWIQRRTDNRASLLSAVERQFAEEMAFVKPIAVQEKAEKTAKAIDDLNAARKERFAHISEALREQRRTAPPQNQMSGAPMAGRGMVRGARGRVGAMGPGGASGYSAAGPYGNAGAPGAMGPYGATGQRMPARRPTEPNEPVIDQETQQQISAWLNSRPEDKKTLLDAVHQMNLADLEGLVTLAEEEKAAKTSASLQCLMMLREQRVATVIVKWQEDDARTQKMQERYGTQGMQGRGMMPGMPPQQQQPMQPGMRGRRR